jgi:Haem-NO-binding
MYGLVNKGVEQMVCSHFSEQTWQAIKGKAGVGIEVFLSMHQYPDDITYRLVEQASKEIGHSPEAVLRAFGRYWMLYTAEEGYGELLNMTGNTLFSFLQNLPNLHARIDLSFPHLQPPIFQCSDITERSMLLHYYSEREGLAPMVLGLLDGLAERFQTPIDVTMVQSRAAGHSHESFQILVRE